MKFRKKPVVIEAFQFTGQSNLDRINPTPDIFAATYDPVEGASA